jgi:AMP nucleosidase
MKTKEDIVKNWLPRYTGQSLDKFGKYILLTNFSNYVKMFAEWNNAEIIGSDKPMQCATANGITIINFGMGGGLKKRNKIGDLILPIAAIRGEGTSNDYLPAEVPAMPAFALQKAISTTIRDHEVDYWTGTVYTTNRRVWEHDEEFKEYLQQIRAYAIDMETATIFAVGFYNKIPTGALLLVSDQPMTPEGVKTEESDKKVTEQFVERHLSIGIDSLKQLINNELTVRHLRF